MSHLSYSKEVQGVADVFLRAGRPGAKYDAPYGPKQWVA